MFVVAERWRNSYPNAAVAILVITGADNTTAHPELERRKRVLEQELGSRFQTQQDIRSLPVIQTYSAYYKRFDKTYHVALQLKTVAINRRPLPTVSTLVDAMFMAEMRHFLLTAGHDLKTVVPPVTVDTGRSGETYTRLNEEVQQVKEHDMLVRDRQGVLSTVIYGPDLRTRITPQTTDALYVVYAPEGIEKEQIRRHLCEIRDSILVASPSACVERAQLLSARGPEDLACGV